MGKNGKKKGIIWLTIDLDGQIREINPNPKQQEANMAEVKNSHRPWISGFRFFSKAERDFLRSLARDCGTKINNRGVFDPGTTREQIEDFLFELRQQYSDVVQVEMFPLSVKRRII